MILLLGGTSETAPIASALAEAGYAVLVSTATDEPLEIGDHANISRRCGSLDEAAMAALIRDRGIDAVVDATHPYATAVKLTARNAAASLGVPYLGFLRESGIREPSGIRMASSHSDAAKIAFSFGRGVLLTTGTRNLAPYAEEARRSGLPLAVRVLPRDESIQACLKAGIGRDRVIAEKGPFSVAENRKHIRDFQAGALVTKDSGQAGGFPEKLEAGRLERCEVVVVLRTETPTENVFASVEDLLARTLQLAPPRDNRHNPA